jgi:DedD protein
MMEQKKILWILFSVTLFLLVVVGTGFIWFFPKGGDLPETAENRPSGETVSAFDPVEWVRTGPAEYPGLQEPEKGEKDETGDDDFVIVYGETGRPEDKEAAEAAIRPSVESPLPAAKPRSSVSPAPPVSAPAAERKPQPVTRNVQVTEYWIQAGSFQSRSGAEEANRLLSEKGFSGRLTTKQVEGSDYYRVRLGPYAKKEEAEKFLNWVKEVDQFGSSYISQVRVTKTISE